MPDSSVSQRFPEGTGVPDQDDRLHVRTLPARHVAHQPQPGRHVQLPEGRQTGRGPTDAGRPGPDQHRVHAPQPAPR